MMTDPLERMRDICLAFPEVTEKLSHGEPSWFVRGKQFAMMDTNHHNSGHIGVWLKAPPGAQDALVEQHPDWYFVPPYVGHRGWVGARLDGAIDWEEVRDIVAEGYRMTAPKRLLMVLDGG